MLSGYLDADIIGDCIEQTTICTTVQPGEPSMTTAWQGVEITKILLLVPRILSLVGCK